MGPIDPSAGIRLVTAARTVSGAELSVIYARIRGPVDTEAIGIKWQAAYLDKSASSIEQAEP